MDFKNKIKLNEPFPILISDISSDFLNNDTQKDIQSEIIKINEKKISKKVMSGRYRYEVNLFKKGSYCKKIFDYFNKESTFNFLLNEMINPDNKFFLKDNFKFIDYNIKYTYSIINKFLSFFLKNKVYLDMDFSIAKKNYFREPHHDNYQRVLSFLLYLNTVDVNSGGSLIIYNYKNSQTNFERFPKMNNLNLFTKIKPKFGKLVLFLSTPNSIHGVEKFIPVNDEKRIFLYGSYTSLRNVTWHLKN